MEQFINIFRFCLLLTLVGCSTFQGITSTTAPKFPVLVVKSDVNVRTYDGKQEAKSAGQKIEMNDGQPILLEAPGKVSVLVLPTQDLSSEVTVTMSAVQEMDIKTQSINAEPVLNDILPKIIEIQTLLANKQPQKAMEKSKSLRQTYPLISYLKVIEGSCLVMLGKLDAAKVLLKSALEDNPGNETARILLSKLEGVK